MAIYSFIEKLGDTAVADVDLKRVPLSSLKEISRDASADGLRVSREYVYASGDPNEPFRVVSTINIDPPTAKKRMVRHNIRVSSIISAYDDDFTPNTLLIRGEDVSANMGFSYPYSVGPLQIAQLRQLLDNTFCFTFLTVTAGAMSTEVLDNFMYRIPDLTV
jgi:hypothetical protein